VPRPCHIPSQKRVSWAFGLLCLIGLAAPLYAEDPSQSEKPQILVPAAVSSPAAPLSAAERAAIMADKELEAKTKFLPSPYLLRNAPTTRADPTWNEDDRSRKREIDRLSKTINRNMRSIDSSIRNMRTTIYRMRSMQRRRF
jgi:hypothetical protein